LIWAKTSILKGDLLSPFFFKVSVKFVAMHKSSIFAFTLTGFLSLVLSACDSRGPHTQESSEGNHSGANANVQRPADPARPGGETTVIEFGVNAFSLPSANMPPSRKVDFNVGNSFFRNPWVIAPSSTRARDGLGPLFNTNACQNCHIKDGRGHPPASEDANSVSMLVRLSIPAQQGDEERLLTQGVITEPVYGEQLQDMAIPGHRPEGRVRVQYQEIPVKLADGTLINLRQPTLTITNPGYGNFHPQTMFSARVAPPMIGLGLLEAIPESALLANEDIDDRDQDGISGKANRVWDSELQKTVIGRFGWKAGKPTLNQQNAAAFAGDIGITSRLHLNDDCTSAQIDCKKAINGNDPDTDGKNAYEVSEKILASVLFYSRNLAVPARRNMQNPEVIKGEKLFHDAGCAKCHTPSFTTRSDAAEPELANQIIFPYTDLLLHDMGEGLADHRPEFIASGSEWRTPPLWGLGLTQTVNGHTQLLHDGRARNTLEAILWHDGEASRAKNAVMQMNKTERNALIQFIESL
jgi:CxxC motif-containing protein (DUF1111 family)